MASRASQLIDEVHRAFDGDPWHGPSLMSLLRQVGAADAERHPVSGAHSIGEIAAHLTAWTNEVARRLSGFPAGSPPEGDWPPSLAATAAGWAAMTLSLTAAVANLETTVAGFPEARWSLPIVDPREPVQVTPVSYEQMVHGLAQHFAYHGGQIALLRRALGIG
jgi:uncharacterized damage-inducible protein DinB